MTRLIAFIVLSLACLARGQGLGPVEQPMFLASATSTARWWPTNTSDLRIWLELTPTNSTADPANNSPVTVWTNLAEPINSFTSDQATHPTNFVSGGGGSNNSPHVYFKTTTHRMVTGDWNMSVSTWMVVCNITGDPTVNNNIWINGGAAPYFRIGANKATINAGSDLSTVACITNQYILLTAVFNGASSRIDTNGVTAVSGDAGSGAVHSTFLANWEFTEGNICRVWCWAKTLSASDYASAVNQCKSDFELP